MLGRRSGRSGSEARRRSGPRGEELWWVPEDQRWAETDRLSPRNLGRGWHQTAMVNNEERRSPLGSDASSTRIEEARQARSPTALDEGRAWRHRDSGALLVLRTDVYGDALEGLADQHREVWRDQATAALEATWRERWRERGQEAGWIEAQWVELPTSVPGRDRIDWLRVEDHSGAIGVDRRVAPDAVVVYEHVTVWDGRRQVTLVLRHALGLDLDDVVLRSVEEASR